MITLANIDHQFKNNKISQSNYFKIKNEQKLIISKQLVLSCSLLYYLKFLNLIYKQSGQFSKIGLFTLFNSCFYFYNIKKINNLLIDINKIQNE